MNGSSAFVGESEALRLGLEDWGSSLDNIAVEDVWMSWGRFVFATLCQAM